MLARSASILNFRNLILLTAFAVLSMAALAADEPVAGPQVGDSAPEIKLPDQNGKMVSLSEQRGKWVVLYFYPKDQTPGCTTEACEFRDDVFTFRKANAVILGVSVDDVESHKAFSEKHGLPFSLLADSGKETARKYGVLTQMGPMTIARRDTFLIDPQGKIVRHYQKVNPNGHSKEVLADIESLKGAAKSKG
ncbi:MAG: peroxiredoxin [Pseudomonadota bacterium]